MTPTRETRLEPIRKPIVEPFLKASELADCELYWISVSSFPPPAPQRAWLLDFFPRLHRALAEKYELRGEFFLQHKTVTAVEQIFRKRASELLPKLGLARRPGAPLPPPPTKDQLMAAVHGAPFDVLTHMPDYCYWLRNPDLVKMLEEFSGLGGAAMFYLKPDPSAKPPDIPIVDELRKLFPQMQWDKLDMMTKAAFASKDKFLTESKKLFGEGLEQDPTYDGLPYILPMLGTSDFFSQPEEERKKWFELFDLFWRESPPDKGIYVASKLPLEELLDGILQGMKEEGKIYPLR